MLRKDNAEHPIPEEFRSILREIVESFVAGDFRLHNHSVAGVRPIDADTADCIVENVAAYGDELAPLNDATWERSIYRWMDGYWLVLVDLTTRLEPVSDLALHAKLQGTNGDLTLSVEAVYVP